jgi:hypothetical protein
MTSKSRQFQPLFLWKYFLPLSPVQRSPSYKCGCTELCPTFLWGYVRFSSFHCIIPIGVFYFHWFSFQKKILWSPSKFSFLLFCF